MNGDASALLSRRFPRQCTPSLSLLFLSIPPFLSVTSQSTPIYRPNSVIGAFRKRIFVDRGFVSLFTRKSRLSLFKIFYKIFSLFFKYKKYSGKYFIYIYDIGENCLNHIDSYKSYHYIYTFIYYNLNFI